MSRQLLGTLGDLIGAGPIRRIALPTLEDGEWQALIEAGAAAAPRTPDEVICEACDEAHPAALEWQAVNRGYVAFCPEAGLVPVDAEGLSSSALQVSWWIEALARALSISEPRMEPLADDTATYLGNPIHDGIEWRAICLCGAISVDRLDRLIEPIERLPTAPLTVVVTFAGTVPRQLLTKQKIWLLRLSDIARLRFTPRVQLEVDRQLLGRYLQGFLRGQSRPVQPGGRPDKSRALVDSVIAEYRATHGPISNKAQAAREIRALIEQRCSTRDLPKVDTIRNRLKDLELHKTA